MRRNMFFISASSSSVFKPSFRGCRLLPWSRWLILFIPNASTHHQHHRMIIWIGDIHWQWERKAADWKLAGYNCSKNIIKISLLRPCNYHPSIHPRSPSCRRVEAVSTCLPGWMVIQVCTYSRRRIKSNKRARLLSYYCAERDRHHHNITKG